ncbi:hypothetical protein HD554DRAFT_2171503 [Boletus coccyginus]|nr:hypothetical protein HD554DRAFT_2171503 [Boletus coccyginus]
MVELRIKRGGCFLSVLNNLLFFFHIYNPPFFAMSFSSFEDILSLSKPSAVDWEKADATDEVAALKTQLDGMTRVVPDEKDELQEERETWCAQWQALVARVHTTFQTVCKIGVSTDLDDDLLMRMCEANASFRRWQGEIAVRKVEEAGQETKGKGAEKVEELPASDLLSETPESASSAGQKRKRTSRKVVLDEEEEEEVEEDDEEVQIVGEKSARTQNDVGKVTHNPGCEACEKAGRKYVGRARRTCNSCMRLKTKCTKSCGKVAKAVGTKIVVSAAKGKVPARALPHVLIPACRAKVSPPRADPSCRKSPPPVRLASPLFFDSPPPEESAGEEEDNTLRKKLKTGKVGDSAKVAMAKAALLSLRTKMHRSLGLLTELQAHARNLEGYVATQQVELEALEATLNCL